MADAVATSTASSSSSTVAQPPKKHDVFISFRGEDTRDNITSHLHADLCRNKIETYIDYRLDKGDEVWPALVRAIQDSDVFLVIFSENYASSTWCLNELSEIMEQKDKGHVVIPVFYKTDPSHVRKQTDSYKVAFAKHERDKKHKGKVPTWKAALTKAADLSGFHSQNYRTEALLIEEIVKCVLQKLRLKHMSRRDLKGLVGIPEQIALVESSLAYASASVRVIGIWGMGGIGKTTIAEAVYRGLRSKYEGCYFLHNVRENWEKGKADKLRKELVSALLQDYNPHVSKPVAAVDYDDYDIMRLGRKKVLVVLDDVNDSEQLEYLCGGHDWLGQGSGIIVTARDKDVLKDADDVYEVKALNPDQALELFCLHAFKKNHPVMDYTKLSTRVVDYAKGIPLALKVLGSLLYRKDKEVWESELEKLGKMPHKKIHNLLKLSYDGLDRDEQTIFLYVACCLKGETIKRVRILLDACGCSTLSGLRNLQDKALMTISEDHVLMHDLIQEMGLETVREKSIKDPGQRSHLWNPNDIYQVLKNCTGTAAIETITLDIRKIEQLSLSPQAFANMHNLKFLNIYSGQILLDYFSRIGGFGSRPGLYLPQGLESLSEELRLLSWTGYPTKSLPLPFCARNLVEFRLQDSLLEKLWEGVQNLENLRILDLRGSKHLIELPDFSKATNLEFVSLSYCGSLTYVHTSILSLHNLQSLELCGCYSLKSLRSDTPLRSLTYLNLDGCSSLKDFSVTSKKMTRLILNKTAINELPSSIALLSKLEELHLDGCESLKSLPNELSYLSSLKRLCLSGCGQLEASDLCIQLGGLQSLRYLKFNGCCNLFGLPDSISWTLVSLLLDGTNVESLPGSIKHLSQLRNLSVKDCERLQSLPKLPPSIQYLWADNCRSLNTVLNSMSKSNPRTEHKRFTLDYVYIDIKEQKYVMGFSFLNCLKLDVQACNAIMADAEVRLKLVVYEHLSRIEEDAFGNYIINDKSSQKAIVWFPGQKVPDWFSHRTRHPWVTIELVPDSKLFGFVFCFIVGQLSPRQLNPVYVECYCHFEASNGERVEYRHTLFCDGSREMAHVYLWYDGKFCLELMNGIRRSRATDQDTTCSSNVTFEFSFIDFIKNDIADKVYECGVFPIYAGESDKQEALPKESIFQPVPLGLELGSKTKRYGGIEQLESGSTGIGVRCSNDEEEDEQGLFLYNKESEEICVPTEAQSQNEKVDPEEKSSCDCLIGPLLKHLWRLMSCCEESKQ